MNKKRSITKALAVFLASLMVLTMIPLSSLAEKYINEYYAASGTQYISIAVTQYSTKSNGACEDQLRNLGFTPVGRNFNAGDGQNSHYVHMGVRYSANPAEAIRAFRIKVGECPNYVDSVINGSTVRFYLIGSGATDWTGAFGSDGVVDLNKKGGGQDLHLYVTRDPNAGPPVTEFTMTQHTKYDGAQPYLPGWYHVTSFDAVDSPKDCNAGQGGDGDYLFAHWRSSAVPVDTADLRNAYADSEQYIGNSNYTQASRSNLANARNNALAVTNAFDNNTGVAPYSQADINNRSNAVTNALNALQTTVYFNGNGGTPSKESKIFTIGTNTSAEVGVSDVTATRHGYDFAGWSQSNAATTGSTDKMTLTCNSTVYAVWRAHRSTLRINPAGGVWNGSAEVTPLTRDYGTVLPVPVPTRTGYQFAGWSMNGTNGTLSGTDAAPQTYTFGPAQDATDTITAQWSANSYTVKYNGNGADGGSTEASTHFFDSPKALTPNGFTRQGFHFNGWSYSTGGAIAFADGDSVTNLSEIQGYEVNLYAIWALNHYTIVYDGNGATSGSTPPTACTYNVGATIANNGFSRTGYTFSGWATEPDGKVKYRSGDTVTNLTDEDSATVVLYAVWTPLKYKITFKNEDGAVLNTIMADYDSVPVYSGPTPVKPQTAAETYVHDGWSPELSTVKGEAEYTARFKAVPRKYKAYFRYANNTLIWTGEFEHGTTPVYGGPVPVMNPTQQFEFIFDGWEEPLTPIDGASQNYHAKFRQVTRKYTAKFLNVDDTTLWETVLEYGSFVSYGGETPVRESDVMYDYSFSGWDPALGIITKDVVYRPLFSRVLRSYTIRFVNEDDSLLKEYSVPYGTLPVYDGEIPQKAPTLSEEYTFAGWDKTVSECSGEATYKARFTPSPRMYSIKFVNFDGSPVFEKDFAYGSTPVCTVVPVRPADAQYTYTFAGWTPEITEVTGDATYTATYSTEFTKHIIKFVNEDGTVLEIQSVDYGTVPVYGGTEPQKAADAQYTYTFAGWTPEITAVTGDATYTAKYSGTLNKYDVVFKNYDGSELYRQNLEYGEIPSYSGEAPVRPTDAQYTYEFAGWGDIKPVTDYAEYTAVFTGAIRQYAVTFVNEDGTVLETQSVDYGTVPVYGGETPVKAKTQQHSYVFAGWTPELEAVKGDAEYTAKFTEVINKYTVTFVNEDGTVLETQTLDYGTVPVYGGETPVKESTDKFSFVWIGWDKPLAALTGDTTYTARFDEVINTYKIVFKNYDGTVLQDDEFAYDELPAYNGEAPVKESSAQFSYVFAGWTPEIDTVKGEATYTAVYTETLNKYHVIFKDWDGTVLQDTEVNYGSSPRYNGLTPVRETDDDYIYTFAGWNEPFAPVTGETVYNAKYTTRPNRFTVKFVDDKGNLLQSKTYKLGEMPSFDGTPEKPFDSQTHYTFIGWDKELTPVTGFVTYVALFEAGAHEITVVSETAPTCTESGKKTVACTVCGFTYTQETSAHGHSYGEAFIENGKAYRECSVCGERIEVPLEEAEKEQNFCKYCGKYHYKYIFPDFGRISCLISRFFTFLAEFFGKIKR